MKRDLVRRAGRAGRDLTGPLSQARDEIRDALGTLLRRAQARARFRADVDVIDLITLLSAIFLAAGDRMPRQALTVIRDGLRPPR